MAKPTRLQGNGAKCPACQALIQCYSDEKSAWAYCHACDKRFTVRVQFAPSQAAPSASVIGSDGKKYVRFLDRAPCSRGFAYAECEAWKASVGGLGVFRAVVVGYLQCPRCQARNQPLMRHSDKFVPGGYGYLRQWIHCRDCHGAIGLELDYVPPPERVSEPEPVIVDGL